VSGQLNSSYDPSGMPTGRSGEQSNGISVPAVQIAQLPRLTAMSGKIRLARIKRLGNRSQRGAELNIVAGQEIPHLPVDRQVGAPRYALPSSPTPNCQGAYGDPC
jgi:hypothetical protein